MKKAISVLLFGTMMIASAAMAAPAGGVKYKTLTQLQIATFAYISCSGKNGNDLVYTSLKYDRTAPIGIGLPIGIISGSIAIVSPNEGLYAHDGNAQWMQMGNLVNHMLQISGSLSGGVHGDYMRVTMQDSTNGKFKSNLYFKSNDGVELNIEAKCWANSYATPFKQ